MDQLIGNQSQVTLVRAGFLKNWMQRAKEFQGGEEAWHRSLLEHLQKALGGKRLLLWKGMLTELAEIINGFPLTGWVEESGVFQPDVRPPEMTVQQLKGITLGVNHTVVNSLRQAAVTELDALAWDETHIEIDRGWLEPCEVEDLRAVHVAKLFPLMPRRQTLPHR